MTMEAPDSSSPGRTGRVQARRSMPGEPMEAELPSQPSTIIRMNMAQLCQPEAHSPPGSERAAASSSRGKGCGSNSLAKATIASRVTRHGASGSASPTWKSSKWRSSAMAPPTRGCRGATIPRQRGEAQ